MTRPYRIAFLFVSVLLLLSATAAAQDPAKAKPETVRAWEDMRYGMFVHWGAYAEAAGIWKGEKIPRLAEQIMRHANVSADRYAEFVRDFNPVEFDPDALAKLAKDSGMKYIVITAKHHDGFSMFHTRESSLNIVDATPYEKDLVKQLADACARQGIKFGVYYSIIDWSYPGSVSQSTNVPYTVQDTIPDAHQRYTVAQLKELLTGYGPLTEIFFDMGKPTLEQSREYARTVRELQPDCLVNGRVSNFQGDFLTMPDNAIPDIPIDLPWEAPSTFYHWSEEEIPGWSNNWFNTWGYKRWIPLPPLELQIRKQLRKMSTIIGRGGNFLLNVGPTGEGLITPYERDTLVGMAEWVNSNGEAIYGTRPSPFKILPGIPCTSRPGKLFFHVFDWPKDKALRIPGLKSKVSRAYLLASKQPLKTKRDGYDVTVKLPSVAADPNVTVVAVEYDGALDIFDPIAVPDASGVITLDSRTEVTHGSYTSQSYKSLVNDTNKSWDVSVPASAPYNVEMQYEKQEGSEEYLLNFAGQELSATLSNNATTASFDRVELNASDRATIKMSHADPWTVNIFGFKAKKQLGVRNVRI